MVDPVIAGDFNWVSQVLFWSRYRKHIRNLTTLFEQIMDREAFYRSVMHQSALLSLIQLLFTLTDHHAANEILYVRPFRFPCSHSRPITSCCR
jgi:hypothetical protein